MPQRTSFTTISPLPPTIRRAQAVAFLQDHLNMIDLNPLVKRRSPIAPPPHCPSDEQHCTWYAITDSISYLPGGLYDGEVNYTAAFHDLPGLGMQSHSYAAMGVEIQGKWTVGGNEPGEKPEVRELGSEAPSEGLYLREECEVKCNMMMTRFIKKTILKSHGKLMSSLIEKAQHYPVNDTGNDGRGRRQQRPPNLNLGRQGALGRSASPSLPSPTEASAHGRSNSEGWGNMSASMQDGGSRRPYATSSELYGNHQRSSDRYARKPLPGQSGSNAPFDRRRDKPLPERPHAAPDEQLDQHAQPLGVYQNSAAAARSTPGLHLYSKASHNGSPPNGAGDHGPASQRGFAELA